MNNIDELRELKEVAKVHGAEEINFRSVADIKTIIEQADKIESMQALCKECADYIDINGCSYIGHGSKLHRDLRKQGGDL